MLPHLASRLFGRPLLVQRAKLDVILTVLGPRLGLSPSANLPEVDLAIPVRPPMPAAANGIAVLPIHGTLVKRTVGLDAASGLTSYDAIGAMLDEAVADPQIAGILLDVDSAGGESSGVFDLARRIRAASAQKPIWAIANDSAFSAAYALASAANRLIVTETGGVGSIGVITLHVDQSVKDAKDGYRYTAITAGAHKNDFSPHAPLSDAAHSKLQAEVDRINDLFVGLVAEMRGLDAAAVRATEAGLFFGPNGVQAGLTDAVGTMESTLSEFATFLNSRDRKPPQARAVNRRAAAIKQETTMQDEPIELIAAEQIAEIAADAKREAVAQAQAIAEMCMIAGCPDRAAEFIAAGQTEGAVRRALLDARATQSDASAIQSTISPDAGTQTSASPDASPVVAAVRKLIKE